MNPLVTKIIRSDRVESFHVAYGVIVDASGKTFASFGEETYHTYVRSSAKPLQSIALIRSGAADTFDLTPKELAVISSSHSGEEIHVRTVQGIFDKVGIKPEHLQCGIHPPIHQESALALMRENREVEVLHNNCSGKHAGILTVAHHMGAPLDSYLEPEHPAQQLIYDIVCEYTDEKDIYRGVDGCSAPVFFLPLNKVALAFARLAAQYKPECEQIFSAMTQNPYLVGGDKRFDTVLMESYPGKILSKGGAEAVLAASVRMADGSVYGLTLKVLDGNYRVSGQMMLKMLETVGFLDDPVPEALNSWRNPTIRNHANHVTGTMVTTIEA